MEVQDSIGKSVRIIPTDHRGAAIQTRPTPALSRLTNAMRVPVGGSAVPDTLRERLQALIASSYTLERELGGGGMPRVFLAEGTRFRRRVVIKVLAPDLATGLSVERLEREIGLAADEPGARHRGIF